ncbi:MAG: DUF503 domain-containing protein [Filifactor alocis]|nr:DUF503 domain-containing protein [Filifactor alocis]
MFIGVLEVELRLFEVRSLKEKRSVLKSLLLRLKNRFNVTVCESAYNDHHTKSEIGIATVSNERKHVESMLQAVIDFIDEDGRLEITRIQREVIS